MLYSLGYGGIMLALAMLVPFFVSLGFGVGSHTQNFIIGFLLCGFLSGAMMISGRTARHRARDLDLLLLMVLFWTLLPLIISLPMMGALQINDFTAAYFETISALTTSGATMLGAPQLETAPLLVWRAVLGWIGGLWILVFSVAVTAPLAIGGIRITDNPLLQHDANDTAVARLARPLRIIFPLYLGGTLLGIIALVISGMSMFDAFAMGLSAISTSGFTLSNVPLGELYSPLSQSLLAGLSFLGALSAPLLVLAILGHRLGKRRGVTNILGNDELRLFVIFILLFALITSFIFPASTFALLLQSISLASTAGFAFADTNAIPLVWVLILPLIGGCALSTAGGIKVLRVVLAGHAIAADLKRLIYPSIAVAARLDNKRLATQTFTAMWAYLAIFVSLLLAALLALGALGLSFEQAWAVAASSLSNASALLNSHNVIDLPTMGDAFKITSSLLMIIGRLEFPIFLVLFTSTFRQLIR